MISFKPFRMWHAADNRNRMELVEKVGLNSRTASKVWKDEPVSWDTVDKICNYYGLRIDQVIEHVPD